MPQRVRVVIDDRHVALSRLEVRGYSRQDVQKAVFIDGFHKVVAGSEVQAQFIFFNRAGDDNGNAQVAGLALIR